MGHVFVFSKGLKDMALILSFPVLSYYLFPYPLKPLLPSSLFSIPSRYIFGEEVFVL